MNAVAMMTPAPKYLANRYIHIGIRIHLIRAARTGKKVAAVETIKMTKRAETRAPERCIISTTSRRGRNKKHLPSCPLYSFSPSWKKQETWA